MDNAERRREYHKQYYEKNKDRLLKANREDRLKRAYGITQDIYNKMLEIQDYKCKICGASEPGRKKGFFPVDHCHTTGKVRGLLCHKCNTVLGKMGDNPETLRAAAKYLEDAEEDKR